MKKRLYLLVKGVGIDLIRIKRIARVYRKRPERFLKKIFTSQEIEELLKKGNSLQSIAARFAAKEAVAKALGCGIGVIRWCEMEILSGARGKPIVFLKGEAARWAAKYGIKGVKVSMSHDGPFAIAKAIAYGD
ncbi:MAG: holo-ACP synthase [Dethiobacteria bacterium]